MSNTDVDPFVVTYEEALENEKVDCDCDVCINIMVHQALVNRDHLENTSHTDNFIKGFDKYMIAFMPHEILCLFAADYLEGIFYQKDTNFTNSLVNMLEVRLKEVYRRFDGVETPKKSEIESFARYITDPDIEKYWCKSSMLTTCLAKEIKYCLNNEIDNNNKEVISLLDSFSSVDALKDININSMLSVFPEKPEKLTEIWFSETCMRMFFRSKKYGSLENSEFAFKAKLSWLFRCIPDWSGVLDKEKKYCLIKPASILNNVV